MQPSEHRQVVRLKGISNREFLEAHAKPGRVGLVGGTTLVDRVIRRAERRLVEDGHWSNWSHAFLFGERRSDGHVWVIESDLQAYKKHIQLGVQENRASKYHDERMYGSMAILDFDLPEEKVNQLLREGLELVANHAQYSLRELIGTLFAMRKADLDGAANPLAREKSFYCSAFVQHVYRRAGIDLAPGIDVKNTSPEHISRTTIPHTVYLLDRELGESKLVELAGKVKQKVRAQMARVKKG